MNRRTLVIFLIGGIISFIIFTFTFNNNLDYMAIGDDLVLGINPFNNYSQSYSDFCAIYLENKNKLKTYDNSFSLKDTKITDIIENIDNPEKKENNINQSILSADIITISLGQKDINALLKNNYRNKSLQNINNIYKYIDELFEDYLIMLNKIRKINDCDIYIIGYYNPLINANQETIKDVNKLFNYIDTKFKMLESNKKIFYISIHSAFNEKYYYIPNAKNPYPSIEGYNYISNKIICKYERKC